MSLSDRIRPGVEAAPWVVEEVKALEAEVARLREDRLRGLKIAFNVTEDCQSVEDACTEMVRIVREQRDRATKLEADVARLREDCQYLRTDRDCLMAVIQDVRDKTGDQSVQEAHPDDLGTVIAAGVSSMRMAEKRLLAEVARLQRESAGAFVTWLNSRPWTDRDIEDELSDFRAALAGEVPGGGAAAREYERGVRDAFEEIWTGLGNREFAIKKFLEARAAITAKEENHRDQ